MRKESKWVYAVLFMAVLLLAAGNSSTVYAKSNTLKTVSISAKELSLTKGQSAALSVKNNRKKVKWASSDKKVASVNGKGKIKALKRGTAVVTAAVGKKKYKCSVTVSDKKANVLIVYFSTTGTTKSAAKKIQKETNGTLIRLQPQKAYTKNYSKLLNVAMDEQESDLRPALATTIKNIKQYDTILLGFPIWHGQAPRIISTFLESYDLSGKTIVPFCISHSSGIGSSAANLHALCPDSVKWAEGRRFAAGTSKEEIGNWLADAGIQMPDREECSHSYQSRVTLAPTCMAEGETAYTCIHCGRSYTEKIPKSAHKFRTNTVKAGMVKDGHITEKCTVCGKDGNKKTIAAVKSIRLSKTSYTYNGKMRKPSVTVTDRDEKRLKEGTDYTVSYPASSKNAGIYTIKVQFRGNYSGIEKTSFQITPKGTAIAGVSAKKKGFTVKWKKQKKQTDEYEIAFSTSSKFPKKKTEIINIKGNVKASKTVSKLKAKKKYYIRIRTYKAVKAEGEQNKIYSGWSKPKTVKTKK